jgi:hypothetical protein
MATNLTINATLTYQVMNGIGSNVCTWSWKNGEIKPALDELIDTLGHNIFRVIHDRMVWAGTGTTRPAATLTGLQNLNPTTLMSVYEVPDMQDLWNTITYMNSKGIAADQILVNFMGWTALWMGGSEQGYGGNPSFINNTSQTNQDIAIMIASLVYYGHHRRDISGSNQNVSFGYIDPFNEPDVNGFEGPIVSASQMNTIFGNIITLLNTMGDTTTEIMGPNTGNSVLNSSDPYVSAFNTSTLSRMVHFSWHAYADTISGTCSWCFPGSVSPASSKGGIKADWLDETSEWCSGCDYNQPPSASEWAFGSAIGDLLLGDIKNGFAAVLTWEAFDTYYYHHNSYSAWGHVGCTQNGSGCTISDTYPRVYSIRRRAWPEATLAKAIRPGMTMLGLNTTLSTLSVLSFYNSTSGEFSIVGHNTGSSAVTINGQLQNLPSILNLSLYQTTSTTNLQHISDIVVASGIFTVSIPADTFFYLSPPAVCPIPTGTINITVV